MILTFLVAFVFSFLGSIPPGAINLSVLQLSVQNKMGAALRFCMAAAIIEYPYAFIAVKFQSYLVASPMVMNHFKLIAASVMILLGVINLYAASKESHALISKFHESGFRKGVIISLLNPLAIPFWIGITAYLNHMNWIVIESNSAILIYTFGISLGTFSLLALLALMGKKLARHFENNKIIKIIPGIVFLCLGGYTLLQYFNLV